MVGDVFFAKITILVVILEFSIDAKVVSILKIFQNFKN